MQARVVLQVQGKMRMISLNVHDGPDSEPAALSLRSVLLSVCCFVHKYVQGFRSFGVHWHMVLIAGKPH